MTATPTATFDAAALRRAEEEADAEGLLALIADDAVFETVDSEHPPSSPLILRGKDEIGAYLRDATSRDMKHRVEDLVQQDDTVAFTVNCEYPDGTRVLCMASARIADGKMVRQTNVQAWDS
jgi:ketosteroid isomerase-like protein